MNEVRGVDAKRRVQIAELLRQFGPLTASELARGLDDALEDQVREDLELLEDHGWIVPVSGYRLTSIGRSVLVSGYRLTSIGRSVLAPMHEGSFRAGGR